jgi:hypothetical protein
MEPRQEEKKTPEGRPEEMEAAKRRFRVVRLEERIAPKHGNNGPTHNLCTCGHFGCSSG